LRNGKVNVAQNFRALSLLSFTNDAISFSFPDSNVIEITEDHSNISLINGINEGDIVGVFIREDYKLLHVENMNVLDIGANIGDSSLWFAIKGASRVYAVEPFPAVYNILVKNIELNSMNEIIFPINAAISPEKGAVKLNSNIETTLALKAEQDPSGDTIIKKIPISEIVGNYVGERGWVLKLDCEGCEYELLELAPESIGIFTELIMEYHHSDPEPLLRVLFKQGFKAYVIKKEKIKPKKHITSKQGYGLIYAKKVK
jgi:FkbM family methyltransferase